MTTDKLKDCPMCVGTGIMTHRREGDTSEELKATKCPLCDGTGKVEDLGEKFNCDEIKKDNTHSQCMHDNCPTCNGTGIRKDGGGMCVHMISCPCPKCSPYC